MPDAKDPSIAAYARVFTSADRLFDAVQALEELGGIGRTASAAGWSPKAIRNAVATLEAARDAIDGQLEAVRGLDAPHSGVRPAQPAPSLAQPAPPQAQSSPPQAQSARAPLARRTPSARSRSCA